MRYQPDHKQEARERMIAAAGRGFRRRGYGGIGVDGLAKEAGVTSGAFYGHFKSKGAAFSEALLVGTDQLRDEVMRLRSEHGDKWTDVFVDFYLGQKRTCELGLSCALQSLTPEVQRSDDAIKVAFEERTQAVIDAIAGGLPGDAATRTARAWALLSILTGAVTLSRAMADDATGEKIAASARATALAVCA